MDKLGRTVTHEGFRPPQSVDALGVSISLQELRQQSRARSPSPSPEECMTRTDPITASEALRRLPPLSESPSSDLRNTNGFGLNATLSPAKPSHLSFSTETVRPPAWEPIPASCKAGGVNLSVQDGVLSPSRDDRSTEPAPLASTSGAFRDFLKTQEFYQEEINSGIASIQGLIRPPPSIEAGFPRPTRLSTSQLKAPPPTPIQSTAPAWTMSSPIQCPSPAPRTLSPPSIAKVVLPPEAPQCRAGTLQGPTPTRISPRHVPTLAVATQQLSACSSRQQTPPPRYRAAEDLESARSRREVDSCSRLPQTFDAPRSASASRRAPVRFSSPRRVLQPSTTLATSTCQQASQLSGVTTSLRVPATSAVPQMAPVIQRATPSSTPRSSTPRDIRGHAVVQHTLAEHLGARISHAPGSQEMTQPRSVSPRRVSSVTRARSISPHPAMVSTPRRSQSPAPGCSAAPSSAWDVYTALCQARQRSASPCHVSPSGSTRLPRQQSSLATAPSAKVVGMTSSMKPGTLSIVQGSNSLTPRSAPMVGTITAHRGPTASATSTPSSKAKIIPPVRDVTKLECESIGSSAPSSNVLQSRPLIAKEMVSQPWFTTFNASAPSQTPPRTRSRGPSVGRIHASNGVSLQPDPNPGFDSRLTIPAPMPASSMPFTTPQQEKDTSGSLPGTIIPGPATINFAAKPDSRASSSNYTVIDGTSFNKSECQPIQADPISIPAFSYGMVQGVGALQQVAAMANGAAQTMFTFPRSVYPSAAFCPDSAMVTPRFSQEPTEQEPDEEVLEREIADAANATEVAHVRLRDALNKLQDLHVSATTP